MTRIGTFRWPFVGGGGAAVAAALVAAALAGALAGFTPACRARAAVCDVCKRDECTALAFRIEYQDGGHQVTCCPRCGARAVAEAKGRRVARLVARDFTTGREIDAKEAVYVEGSDVEHCSAPRQERAEADCCRELTYDRCLPSLIAFQSADAAQAFSRDHGGAVRSFGDLHFGRP